jgi:BRCA1-associated protein
VEARGVGEEEVASISLLEADSSKKLEALLIEYNYLLSSQLEKQRLFFEKQLKLKESEIQRVEAEEGDQKAKLEQQNMYLAKRDQTLTKALQDTQGSLAKLEQQAVEAQTRGDKLMQLNQRLLQQQTNTRDSLEFGESRKAAEQTRELDALDAQQKALEDEVRDLKFYLTTQRTIEKNPLRKEIEEGHMIVVGNEEVPIVKKGKRGKRAGKR